MDQKTVLIAGASRGLGLNFARKYLEEGWRVLAGVRGDGHPGENSIGGLKTEYPDSLYPLRMDLTDTASVEETGNLDFKPFLPAKCRNTQEINDISTLFYTPFHLVLHYSLYQGYSPPLNPEGYRETNISKGSL